MVDVQTISIILAACSFILATAYYVINIQEVRRNRRITLTTTLLQHFMTDDGYMKIMELGGMKWDDLDDYFNKYDSRVNPENAAKRMSLWNTFNTIGMLYRKGLLDMDTILASSGGIIYSQWVTFKPIVEFYRGTDYGENSYQHWEYLAEKLGETRDVSTRTRWDTMPSYRNKSTTE